MRIINWTTGSVFTIGLTLAMLLAMVTAMSPALARPELEIEPYTFTAGDGTEVAAERGTFHVRVNRDDANSATIAISFVRFPATTDNPGAPIVYLSGGPGGSGTGTARGPRFPLFMALREVADVIAFDQRGTGLSERVPDCVDPAPAPVDSPLTRANFVTYFRAEVARCWAVWEAQGIDISAYNTWESAADVNDLRLALGEDRIDLWGISYGSHLGFAIMKRYPDTIRRAVFAGAEGLDQTVKYPSYTDELFERIEAMIAEDPVASQYYPDLTGTMRRVHAQLAETPVAVTFTPQGSDEPVTMNIGAFPIQMLTGFLIKNPQSLVRIPLFYLALDNGQYERAAQIIYGFFFEDPGQMRGMPIAMDLASGISEDRRALVAEQSETSLLGDALNFPMPHIAGVIPEADLGDAFREPVETDIPTLFLSGDLDGRTYLPAHAAVIEGFSNATQLIVRNGGHDLFEADQSIQDVVVRYFQGEDVSDVELELEMPPFATP